MQSWRRGLLSKTCYTSMNPMFRAQEPRKNWDLAVSLSVTLCWMIEEGRRLLPATQAQMASFRFHKKLGPKS